jgi:NitT/TauT family transport system permease protein
MGREMNDASQVIGIMLITILVGILFDRVIFLPIETRLRHRWGVQKSA